MPQPIDSQEVAASSFPVTAIGQRTDCSNCHPDALDDATLGYVIDHWAKLPPHVRDCIVTLVEAQLGSAS